MYFLLTKLVELLTPSNWNRSVQLACPPKKANTCESVRFDGRTISGTVNFARAANEFVSLAQSGNISAKEKGESSVVEAAEAVSVAVTTAVAVTIPLSVVDEDEDKDVAVVVLSAKSSVTVGSTVVTTVTTTTPVSVAGVVLSSRRIRDEMRQMQYLFDSR